MIEEVKEIIFNANGQTWDLWYINRDKSLNKIEFSTKKNANFFQYGFKLMKNSNIPDILDPNIIKKIVILGRSSKAIENILFYYNQQIYEKLNIHLGKFLFKVNIQLDIKLHKNKN
jgi:hypothetical protein